MLCDFGLSRNTLQSMDGDDKSSTLTKNINGLISNEHKTIGYESFSDTESLII